MVMTNYLNCLWYLALLWLRQSLSHRICIFVYLILFSWVLLIRCWSVILVLLSNMVMTNYLNCLWYLVLLWLRQKPFSLRICIFVYLIWWTIFHQYYFHNISSICLIKGNTAKLLCKNYRNFVLLFCVCVCVIQQGIRVLSVIYEL